MLQTYPKYVIMCIVTNTTKILSCNGENMALYGDKEVQIDALKRWVDTLSIDNIDVMKRLESLIYSLAFFIIIKSINSYICRI